MREDEKMLESYFSAASRRRSRLEVKISILMAISEGATRQAEIMSHSNLSWSFAQTFIRILERQGLISTVMLKGKRNFTLSERGKRALTAYTAVTTALDFDSIPSQEVEESPQSVPQIESVPSLTQKE